MANGSKAASSVRDEARKRARAAAAKTAKLINKRRKALRKAARTGDLELVQHLQTHPDVKSYKAARRGVLIQKATDAEAAGDSRLADAYEAMAAAERAGAERRDKVDYATAADQARSAGDHNLADAFEAMAAQQAAR
jgi:hypothetical protein